jgi:hypothetical protein
MLNSCDQLKSKHKEKKCKPRTANTNTVLDKVMLQIPLNTKLPLTAIPEDNKQPRLQEALHLFLLLLTDCNNHRLNRQVC